MKNYKEYAELSNSEALKRIKVVRASVGDRLSILAHYYALDEIVELADFVGDSLALAKKAVVSSADAVLFCGVRFMLETADVLLNRPERVLARGGRRAVVMAPDLTSGCPMADMIDADQANDWKRQLETIIDFSEFTPITYVNSSAETKAFCGRYGGSVCTSANAEKVVRVAFERRPKLLFMPDSRLGLTTSLALGVDKEEIVLWRPNEPLGGNSHEAIQRARVILWDGYCPVHQRFSAEWLRRFRAKTPGAQFWVHPEAQREIVELSDGYGSTTKLLDVVANAPQDVALAIGTEWKLVDRIRRQNPGKKIFYPGDEPSVCVDMSKSTLQKTAWVLENWADGNPVNIVSVSEDVAKDAYCALESLL